MAWWEESGGDGSEGFRDVVEEDVEDQSGYDTVCDVV